MSSFELFPALNSIFFVFLKTAYIIKPLLFDSSLGFWQSKILSDSLKFLMCSSFSPRNLILPFMYVFRQKKKFQLVFPFLVLTKITLKFILLIVRLVIVI